MSAVLYAELLLKIVWVPRSCSTELSDGTTQVPSVVTPISLRKNERVPDEDCGMTGTTWSVPVPPTSFHVTGPPLPPIRLLLHE